MMSLGSKGGFSSGIGGGSSNQQQNNAASNMGLSGHPLYRGYSPSKPKWKGSQGTSGGILGGGPGSTGFSYQQPG